MKWLRAALCLAVLAVALTPAPAGCGDAGGELVFGMSAPLRGPNRGLGIEFYRGISACFRHVNESGGVQGLRLRLIALDDGYSPEPCIKNTIRLVREDRVFALFSYVGTPTTTRMLPLLQRFADEDISLLFPLTGARPMREPPYGQRVFNLRASYAQETRGLVEHLARLGRTRIAVFFQEDAYGRGGWDGVREALRGLGKDMVGEAAYRRGAGFETDFRREVGILMGSHPDAVVTVGTYAACAAFIRDARDAGLSVPIACVSFSDTDNMLKLLAAVGQAREKDYTADLICSQVVPSYEDTSLPAVVQYRDLMDRYASMPPESARDSYEPNRFSFISFEGFLNARLLAEVVRRLPQVPPRRADLPLTLEALGSLDIGIGEPVRFGPDRHQGLDTVYFTTIEQGRIVPIRDWSRWRL